MEFMGWVAAMMSLTGVGNFDGHLRLLVRFGDGPAPGPFIRTARDGLGIRILANDNGLSFSRKSLQFTYKPPILPGQPAHGARMKFLAGLLALAGLSIATAQGHRHGAHEHGVARLQVAVEGDGLELRFESPLDNLVGFETAPRNDKQRRAVRRMVEQLHQPQRLFVPTADADCTPASVALASDVIKPDLLASGAGAGGNGNTTPGTPSGTMASKGEAVTKGDPATKAEPAQKGSQAGRKPADQGHADLEAEISFRCARPQALTGLQVGMFKAFPQIRRIDVQIVTSKGQSGARLSPNRTGLTW